MKYLIKICVCILVGIFLLGINQLFSEEKQRNFLAESEQFKNNREGYLNFVKNLNLQETIVLGSQIFDKYGKAELLGFMTECLGPKWTADLSTIPETISIVLNEELNPEWEKFLIDNFKRTDFSGIYKDGEQMLPHFLRFIEDKSKDEKTKVVLLETIGCWFDGYKERLADPLDEEDASENNFKLVHKQANMTMDTLNKIIQDEEISKEGAVASRNLYVKIHKIYLDKDNELPVKFKKLRYFKQIKTKLEKSAKIFSGKR